MNEPLILVINPGSTSTKAALYRGGNVFHEAVLEHRTEELRRYPAIAAQKDMRRQAVLGFLSESGCSPGDLDAVAGRGGLLPPLQAGTYRVNEKMVRRLETNPAAEHASNLGAPLAMELAGRAGCNAYICDPVTVDELEPAARLTGIPEIRRKSLIHALNMRAAAIKTAEGLGKAYRDSTFIVAHLGGGITLSLHHDGRMIDIVSDDEGPFSPERCGRVPAALMADFCRKHEMESGELKKRVRGKAGLTAHCGTNRVLDLEERIRSGDPYADLVLTAMMYQVAKSIGELAPVVSGRVDRIILTGGIAQSERITGWIAERVSFIAPVEVVPGENEMEALALGVLRVLSGTEEEKVYDID